MRTGSPVVSAHHIGDDSRRRLACGHAPVAEQQPGAFGVVLALLCAMLTEISSAAGEQSTGMGQMGDAVAQLDQVTQQNVALVEQSASAAESLRTQAANLVEAMRVFELAQ